MGRRRYPGIARLQVGVVSNRGTDSSVLKPCYARVFLWRERQYLTGVCGHPGAGRTRALKSPQGDKMYVSTHPRTIVAATRVCWSPRSTFAQLMSPRPCLARAFIRPMAGATAKKTTHQTSVGCRGGRETRDYAKLISQTPPAQASEASVSASVYFCCDSTDAKSISCIVFTMLDHWCRL